MKYEYKYHSEIPSELKNVKSIVENADVLQSEYIERCSRYQKSKISKSFRHHFNYDRKMGIKHIVEFKNLWNGNPSKYFVTRDFMYQNERCVEFTELYQCRDCEVYCWSNNRHIQPQSVWSLIFSEMALPTQIKEML